MKSIDFQVVHHISDTKLYQEACAFAEKNSPPSKKQLIGLISYSKQWSMLLRYIDHQRKRDLPDAYGLFYKALQQYLNAPQGGLAQRVKTEFHLIDEGLPKNEKRQLKDAWSQALAQEFVTHLVAQSLLKQTQEER
ncbi:MAG: hypothetical protein HC828_08040 [Blastochloris sp.]|nr:hypothetical protein [Blastochloris sp.]